MPKEKMEIEIQDGDGLDDFLSDDDGGNETSNKVSFQIDVDGNTIQEDEGDLELEVTETGDVIIEEEPIEEDPAPVAEEDNREDEEKRKKAEATEKKRKSRAKQRIQDLNEKNRQLEMVLEQQNAQMEKLQSEYDETTSTYAKVELERLTADVARLEAQLKRAAEDNDGEAIASVTKQLIDSQTHIRNLQSMVNADKKTGNNSAQAQNPQPNTREPQSSSLSEAAEDWTLGKEFIINNDEYRELTVDQRKLVSPVRQEMANVARQLLQEGFSNTDPIFYEEMDIRLTSKFDYYEALANDGVDALEYINSDKGSNPDDTSGETEKPQKANKAKKVPAKGASRSSSPNLNNSTKSNKVVITKEMHNYWKNHLQRHMTLEEYALEVKKDQQRTKF
jgi:hypothetical protein